MLRSRAFTLTVLAALAWSTLPPLAGADPVIVEFTTADGRALVAGGDTDTDPGPWDPEAAAKRIQTRAAAIALAREDLLASLPPDLASAVVASYENFPFLRMDVDEAGRQMLLLLGQVSAVYDDRARQALTASALAYIGADAWHEQGGTGEGTAVAVLDTGIRYWDGFFGDCAQPGDAGCRVKVFEGFATLRGGTGTTDPVEVAEISGHGTNVGGIVGDVAPGADLLSLGVFAYYDPDPASGFQGGVLANDGDVAEALDWIISHREAYNIVAANLSLGSDVDPDAPFYCTGAAAGAYGSAFANVRDAGVLAVVATGNDYVKTAVAPPSCVASAVRVGAGYDDPAFGYTCGTGPVVPGAVTCFSNSSSLVDFIAPGNDIDAGGLQGYSGTSMATPFVAGLVAVVAALHGDAPVWTIERMRADAVPTVELGPRQDYVHRYVRMGGLDAPVRFSTGVILVSDFEGLEIPDGSDAGVEVSGDAACEAGSCFSDAVGNLYLDLNVAHEGTGDLVVELQAPDGTVARHEVEGDDELGLTSVNSILGSQHLPGVFDGLKGAPISGTWTLRLFDDTPDRQGRLYRAALLLDPARLELDAALTAPAVARPDEPFDVDVAVENNGNIDVDGVELRLELIDEGGRIVDAVSLSPGLPMVPGVSESYRVSLAGPQGDGLVRLTASDLDPDLPPGFHCDPAAVSISYRTFASFEVDPPIPNQGQEARLVVLSRGIMSAWAWDFGDGSTSTDPAPSHIWREAGVVVVSLTVTGPDGMSTTARRVWVDASLPAPVETSGGCSCGVAGAGAAPGTGGAAVLLGLAALLLAGLRVSRRRLAAAVAAIALAAAGCTHEEGREDAGVQDGPPSSGPWISLLDPPDPSMGIIPVHLMLSDEDAAPCDVTMDWHSGAGDLRPMTLVDGDTTAGLPSAPSGVEHDVQWLSTADLPDDTRDVEIRAGATCGGKDALPVFSRAFTVLNFFVSRPHAVLITEISTAEDNLPAEIQSDYIEIANTTDEPIVPDGWKLMLTRGGEGWSTFDLEGLTLTAGGRAILAGPESDVEADVVIPEPPGWDLTKGGAVALVADHGRGVDFVRWGGCPATPPEDLQWTDDPPLPVPQTTTVLSRIDEETDTDRAGDFCVGRPTPGAPSPGCVMRSLPGEVLISEMNSQGSDDEIEVLNASGGSIDLGGWVLMWDGDDLGSGAIPLGSFALDDGARLVLRDNGVAGSVSSGIMRLGENVSIDGLIPIALAMRSPYGDIVDFVAAGGSTVRWMDWHGEEPTPMPGPETTLSRRPGDPDTDSGSDFCLTEPNMSSAPEACLEPLGVRLTISEVMPGRPDWVEIFNAGPDAVDLGSIYLGYTTPFAGSGSVYSVEDFRLRGTLEAGAFAVVSEGDIAGISEILVDQNIWLGSDGDGSVALRDAYGFGIDFVLWGEAAGTALWPDTWSGLGADIYETDEDQISIERYRHGSPDTQTREDWCWAPPSPLSPNAPCND